MTTEENLNVLQEGAAAMTPLVCVYLIPGTFSTDLNFKSTMAASDDAGSSTTEHPDALKNAPCSRRPVRNVSQL